MIASRPSADQLLCVFRRYEEDMYWRRMEEEQHHWDERRRLPDGGYPQGPPGLLGVRPGMPGLQPQGSVVRLSFTSVTVIALSSDHITLQFDDFDLSVWTVFDLMSVVVFIYPLAPASARLLRRPVRHDQTRRHLPVRG